MKRTAMTVMLGGALLGLVTPTFAQGHIRQREANQQKRIGEGVENGSLTPRETARLERQEGHINREIQRDKADGGGLSPAERAKITRQQNRESRRIYTQKHDGQTQ
jgi:hypothetical protein